MSTYSRAAQLTARPTQAFDKRFDRREDLIFLRRGFARRP
jgi:hypothetical protein